MVAGARTGIFGAYRGQMGCGVGSADSPRLGGALGGGVCRPLPADGVAVLGETKRAGGGGISWVGARWRSPATHLEMPGTGLVFGEPLSPPGCAPQNGATPRWGRLHLPGGPPLSLSRVVWGGSHPLPWQGSVGCLGSASESCWQRIPCAGLLAVGVTGGGVRGQDLALSPGGRTPGMESGGRQRVGGHGRELPPLSRGLAAGKGRRRGRVGARCQPSPEERFPGRSLGRGRGAGEPCPAPNRSPWL